MPNDLQSNLRLTLASVFERESELTLVVIAFDEWSDDEEVKYFLGTWGREQLRATLGESSLVDVVHRAATRAAQEFATAYGHPPAVLMTWFIDGQFRVATLTDMIIEKVAGVLPGYINGPVGDDEIDIVRTRFDKSSVPESAWLDPPSQFH